MQTFYLDGVGGISGIKQLPAGTPVRLKAPFAPEGGLVVGGIAGGNTDTRVTSGNTPTVLASAATVAFTPAKSVTTHTPTQDETINFSAPPAFGTVIYLEIVTSGVTSRTLTFGTNTKNTGTLATGTTTAKTFMLTFVSDGTNWVETARTAAM